jgi:outer membrane receptor protein involved in Fe transport
MSRSRLALAIAATLSSSAAMHVAPASAVEAPGDVTLEEVVVTARKRTENLQDVPVSIDVFTSKDLQNLAISQFEDYASRTPSISFVSAGPGTQTFVMRGVSDGSNPSYANTASTAFLLDDMSMNYYGTTPDLHLYDIAQIEVLNGPQGTTFGAGAMAGALRFITNKPDPKAFSAGIDVDGGKVESGSHNGTVEGFINIPLIADWTALRISAFSDYHGGYINNLNTTRNWVNGTVSNNSQWSGKNYNVEKVTGARIALGQVIADGWKASLTYSYQRELTHGAWDQDPTIGGAVDAGGNLVNGPVRSLGSHNVDRFGPESKQFYTKTLDFHLEGDVGIGDLVYASTYWAQDDRTVNEYSEYMQYVNTGTLNATARQAFDCLTDPINGGASAAARYPPCPTTTFNMSIAGRTSCACNRRRAVLSTGWSAPTGRRRATSTATTFTCRDCRPRGSSGRRTPPITDKQGCLRSPTIGTATRRAPIICKRRNSPILAMTSPPVCMSRRGQCTFTRVSTPASTGDFGSHRSM